MSEPNSYIFREEEKPRFKLRTASGFALLLLLLLFWTFNDTNVFQLSAEELRALSMVVEGRAVHFGRLAAKAAGVGERARMLLPGGDRLEVRQGQDLVGRDGRAG